MSLLTNRAFIPSHVVVRTVADEAVLLNLDTEHYYTLDSVATSMMRHATTCPNLKTAVEQLLKEYDVNAEELLRDFESLIRQLLQAKLLELQPPEQPLSQ
ncbi:MAG: PqqD family protein [Chloracidobacterium sp.]|uniref:PqqD family protein n=1 Tax=Chloracidobacterium validum TaxID=2821543 RepID=A0ABX8B9H2_9BACT|nr:PqqD family protein [Chloracidobacterium validum]QUW03579.1 PqqD family protein [Chloracidobacterium validum]